MSIRIKLIIMWLLLCILMIGANIPAPLYEMYSIHFHFGTFLETLVFSMYVITLIPSMLFSGRWSDKHGKRSIIISGMVLAISGSLLFMFAENITSLFLARSIQGIAAGMVAGPATAFIGELTESNHTALIGASATSSGTAIGPLMGGIIFQYLPYKFHLVYIIYLIIIISISIVFTGIGENIHNVNSKDFHSMHYSIPKKIRPVFVIASTGAFIVWSITAFYMSLASTFIYQLLHITDVSITGGIVFLMLIISFITQMLSRNFNSRKMLISGLIISVMALLFIVCSGIYNNVILFLIATVMAGTGQGLAFLGSMGLITRSVSPSNRGYIISMFYITIYLGVGIPIVVIGLFSELTGIINSMIIYFIFILILSVSVIIMIGMERRRGGITAI